MHVKNLCLAVILVCLVASLMTPAAVAQEGHPLVGIWLGDWGPTASDRSPVLIDMSWTNTTLSGMINPGFPDAATIRVGSLDSKNWTVHLEADSQDENGNAVVIIVDGALDNIGSSKRTLRGTWSRGDIDGEFSLTRE
jgi:hypothetical protein